LDRDYWVEISQRGALLGAGSLLTEHYALTAAHCVRGIDFGKEGLKLSFASGEMVTGRVCENAAGADLALIEILEPCESPLIPNVGRAVPGDMWSAPYRPSTSHPYLGGTVLSGAIRFRLEMGDEIEALQLDCSQHLGDYSGYSGGPVERQVTSGEPALLGVLLEQYPDRHSSGRASNVLFAATIAEALRRFDCLDTNHLLKMFSSPDIALRGTGSRDRYGSRIGSHFGHVFISYVREDARDVDKLQLVLEAAGVRVWRDTADLWPGEDWRSKIKQAITHDALVFLACFSTRSLARKVSYQNEELALAIDQMRLRSPQEPWLIPVRFDNCVIPDLEIGGGRSLASIQRADLFDDPSGKGATRLTTAVLRILMRDKASE
jgi:hypothetical protein